MGAPCTFTVPGTVVRVVKSISETSECVPVSFDINVDCWTTERGDMDGRAQQTFPTEGNPTKPTEAIPVLDTRDGRIEMITCVQQYLATSKPRPPPPPPPPVGEMSSRLSFASFAFS
jgi:hypothetical protein